WFKAARVANPNISSSTSIAGLYFNGTGTNGYTISASAGQTLTLTGSATSIGSETSASTALAIAAATTSGTNTIAGSIILAVSSAERERSMELSQALPAARFSKAEPEQLERLKS